MRIRSVLTTVLVALMLVVGADYVALAAGGSSFLLGKTNKTAKQTTLVRTGSGPALKLKTKPSAPPLKVTSKKMVKKLNADKLDGLDAVDFTSTVTAFQPPGCPSLATASTTPAKIADLGTFTKQSDDTLLRVDYSTAFEVQSSASTGVIYEVRIDGVRTSTGLASLLVREVDTSVPGTITGLFTGISSGVHTVEVWAATANSTASGVFVDIGCFNSKATNNVYVTEQL